MKITSSSFLENGKIPKIHAKLGGNQRPPLTIQNAPENTKSLVIICHDPDAPRIGGFYHWTVWNLPPETKEISSDSLPDGATEGITSWKQPGWNGPQPPFGTHRYQFYVYALDTILDLPESAKPKELKNAIAPHIIDQDVLTGKFGVLDNFRQ